MIESHISAGAQKFTPGKDDVHKLEYGKSITDACLGWDEGSLRPPPKPVYSNGIADSPKIPR
jgi:hypothetical protein